MPPAPTLTGRSLTPLTEKAWPVTPTCVTCTAVELEFLRRCWCWRFVPSDTEPKATRLGDAESGPACAEVPTSEFPSQLLSARDKQLKAASKSKYASWRIVPHSPTCKHAAQQIGCETPSKGSLHAVNLCFNDPYIHFSYFRKLRYPSLRSSFRARSF